MHNPSRRWLLGETISLTEKTRLPIYCDMGEMTTVLPVLLAMDLVEKKEGTFRLTDPVMSDWLRE